ncbi:Gfo/Idh/MocA family oxidoreductase [candidate division KSB1 bacterium]|nr:Gfo/Idh/MocA family oxidoreductase [candidate division KSB1 bacterium]
MSPKSTKFGIIGLGLMGREFAGSVARWCHLRNHPLIPKIVAVCDSNPALFPWYVDHFASVRQQTTDYRLLLENPDVEAVFCAVPHHLHQEIYCATIDAGKHLMGEKPFGIDRTANERILESLHRNPHCFVRCTSEFPFFPAVQRLCDTLQAGRLGRIIEVNAGFKHSSDLDPNKPINWKRRIETNGKYGCMGDLGMHVCHVPFRAGWQIENVRALLSNIVKERPDSDGNRVPCETWDNAVLLCEARQEADSPDTFPLTLKMQRIAPGEKNSWYLEILGTRGGARFSTKNPKRLELLDYAGGEQSWQSFDMGHETAYTTHTGAIFEFGFSDSILQMWAAYLAEYSGEKPLKKFATCVTPAETALSHILFTAALQSHQAKQTAILNA